MKEYIHYGHKAFDRSLFQPITNHKCWKKPLGGLWASPVDAPFGWKAWCESESFRECEEDNAFRFTLKPESKVFRIECLKDFTELMRITNSQNDDEINFEKLAKLYDAVDFVQTLETNMVLNDWDCDCILVMNPGVILIREIPTIK